MKDTITFLVVPELFDRYIIVVNPVNGTTSVYCQNCDIWVARYEGDQLTTHSEDDLMEKIVSDHEEDFATTVEFHDGTERFK